MRVGAIAGLTIPSFWLGIVLILAPGAGRARLRRRSATCRSARIPLGNLQRMILPAIALALPILANLSRLVRSAMLDALGQDYIRTARAKGAQRAPRRLQARAAQRADPVRHQRRHHDRLPARRRHRGRAGLRHPGPRAADSRRHRGAQLSADPGDDPRRHLRPSCSSTSSSTCSTRADRSAGAAR